MKTNGFIGVFDSGLGGLSVLKEVHRLLPQETTIYLGDTARVPYGTKAPETINRYALNCAKVLADRAPLKMLLVACNTVSAVALDHLRELLDCPVVGVVEPGALAVVSHNFSSVGVIGTSSTILSAAYEHHLRRLGFKGQIYARACPLFVPLVEEGLIQGEIADAIAQLYLNFIPKSVEAVILGCTHYPLLLKTLQKQFDHKIQWIDSGREAALVARQILAERSQLAEQKWNDNRFLVTEGCDKFLALSEYYLGQKIPSNLIELVDI